MAKTFGIDVSHWQGNIDWKKVAADGVKYAILKCSEGTTYQDPTFTANRDKARANGILVGAYHFARATDPVREADFFAKSVGEMQAGELVALDWEVVYSDPVGWCKRFLDRCADRVGFKPLIYINSSTAKRYNWSLVERANYGLWIANYGMNLPVVSVIPPATGAWDYYAIWQYTSRGRVSGISGNVDLNTANMDLETLKKYGKPGCNKCCAVHCPK